MFNVAPPQADEMGHCWNDRGKSTSVEFETAKDATSLTSLIEGRVETSRSRSALMGRSWIAARSSESLGRRPTGPYYDRSISNVSRSRSLTRLCDPPMIDSASPRFVS